MNCLISIIVPVYKVEKYLPRCIESIINQTHKNLEIILVDDGSPDNCPQICDEYAKKDGRIKVIHKKNGGVSSARNVGIENSTSKYIAFVDSDDYLDLNFFESAMSKVAIITHYYNSFNYGGNLQAYALTKIISNHKCKVEQISYNMGFINEKKSKLEILRELSFCDKILKISNYFLLRIRLIPLKLINKKIEKSLQSRKNAFKNFNQNKIPHSDKIYTEQNIDECVNDYDIFITGSDQVWNPIWYKSAYFLDFVPSNKPKFSYAASISQSELSVEQKEIFKKSLSDFIDVSVRERNAVDILKDILSINVECSLDPTLLLTSEEWDEICAERLISEKYIFCYFLGGDKSQRKLAKQFAKKHDLQIVTLPYLSNTYRRCDFNFGDKKLFDVSPEEFISLIKFADYIFTDSFHGAVFSSIYKKEYYVFERSGYKEMSSRIYTLVSLFGSQDHFCDAPNKVSLTYLDKLSPIDYSLQFLEYKEKKEKSLVYIKRNLEKADGLLKKHES